MSEKFRLGRRIGFQNTFYTKCINVLIDSIGPSIILRSISRKIAFGTTWVWRGLGSMNKGPNATICLVRRQNHAGTTVSWTTVQREKSSHAYNLSSNVQTACSTDSLNNCPKHSILRFSSFALKIYL